MSAGILKAMIFQIDRDRNLTGDSTGDVALEVAKASHAYALPNCVAAESRKASLFVPCLSPVWLLLCPLLLMQFHPS